MRSQLLLLTFLILSGVSKGVLADPSFRLVTNGPTGEFVSQGQPHIFSNPARTIFADVFDRSAPTGTDFFRLQTTYQTGETFQFNVGTDALGANLTSANYSQAQRASFAAAGYAGIDVSINGYGCGRISGSFVIHSVVIAASQEVESIDVSFTQLCEEQEPALIGRFTYNASGASIPERAPYATNAALPVHTFGENRIVLLVTIMAVIGSITNRFKQVANKTSA